ncbi:hypothetical protein pb186bvf_018229 [Paramecium bursaria]
MSTKGGYVFFLVTITFILTMITGCCIQTLLIPLNQGFTSQMIWIPLSIFFIMFLWSIIQCNISDPVKYLDRTKINENEKNKRFCLLCKRFKPERSHHCSRYRSIIIRCNTCVLVMDHHCVWIRNCVGYHNRKYFILFLFYFNLTLLLELALLILQNIYLFKDFKQQYDRKKSQVILLFVQSIILILFEILLIKYSIKQIRLVSKNITTIEQLANLNKPQQNQYDLGLKQNWFEVMGRNSLYWFLPIKIRILVITDEDIQLNNQITQRLLDQLNQTNQNQGDNQNN